jgi:hypothetical protein
VADIRESIDGYHVFGAGAGGFLSPEQKRDMMLDPYQKIPPRKFLGVEREVLDNLSRTSTTCDVFKDGRCFISGPFGNLVFKPTDVSEETFALFMSRVS